MKPTPNRADLEPRRDFGQQFVTRGGPIDREVERYIERGCVGPVPPSLQLNPDPLWTEPEPDPPPPPQPRRLGCVFVVALVLLWAWL